MELQLQLVRENVFIMFGFELTAFNVEDKFNLLFTTDIIRMKYGDS